MGNHWPLLVAAILIALATFLGVYQHNRAVLAATTSVPLTARTVAENGAAGGAVLEKPTAPPAAPQLPAAPDDQNVPARRRTVPQGDAPATAPINPTVVPAAPTAPATALQPVQAAPAAPAVPAAPGIVAQPAPAAPAVPAAPPVIQAPAGPAAAVQAKREDRAAVLADLRGALQGKLGVMPIDLAAGGYAAHVEGARVEVQPVPNWSISLFNINPKTPDQETSNFKLCLETVTAALAVDMTQKAVESANGKRYMKTSCKLGSVSLVRDPANGNSCMIRPIQTVIPTAHAERQTPGQPAVQPAQQQHRPKVLPGPPVPPPRPPATDTNF